ncbi:11128_t:CDS:2 [Dentiscutata heterogama]|uniref:11128_t:CDS:1 n=1 Tax=Dentiscutata heterogama TaxID=1316150 RepID=A0ACA9LNP7_9GLOM|nr:11128_t:CDS:2 [Dentiscutata heterogama]
MSNSISTSRFTCTLYTHLQSYKTKCGLQYHETIKHKEHNILPSHILPLPNYELDYIKKIIVREIQKHLKKYHCTVRNQVFSLHCSENTFRNNSYNILTNIFNNAMWGERDYAKCVFDQVKICKENIFHKDDKVEIKQACFTINDKLFEIQYGKVNQEKIDDLHFAILKSLDKSKISHEAY